MWKHSFRQQLKRVCAATNMLKMILLLFLCCKRNKIFLRYCYLKYLTFWPLCNRVCIAAVNSCNWDNAKPHSILYNVFYLNKCAKNYISCTSYVLSSCFVDTYCIYIVSFISLFVLFFYYLKKNRKVIYLNYNLKYISQKIIKF